ncbi:GNAT family N-acetyltransferase [Limnoglobus roseus]|uniref:Class I SAM-dependent methyltransferase n=1 Tax=Limnoglobus roseus TaxID=2598579 RepID=A0A5C1A5B5_9BACT|nr:GNAT family N-acetyltransferase [Limnoglobus roseus]QEL14329.1 class I SAM-dependent methyltransferase [Limnoglobus roseus]
MDETNRIKFRWVAGKLITEKDLADCSSLFSSHYGLYDLYAPDPSKRGQRVRMAPSRQKLLLNVAGAWAAMAHLDEELVAYAFLVRGQTSGGTLSWVTQLVVHTEHQKQGIASRLLHAAWGLSDEFGWGLVTASPYAVRALENATRRRCDPGVIRENQEELGKFAERFVNYVKDTAFVVDEGRCEVNTEFFVDHSEVLSMVANASKANAWTLGPLDPGHEWLAFVFQPQDPRELTVAEFDRLVADQDSTGIVREAYARMTLDGSHKWNKGTVDEVDFSQLNLDIPVGGRVLDIGCGLGRHTIELAKRGYSVVGVDFVERFIHTAQENAAASGVEDKATFLKADARDLHLGEEFDAVVCLYDVIGSFPDDLDNRRIVEGVSRHLRPGGKVLLSVMNRGLVEAVATHKGDIHENLHVFAGLKPSLTMQQSGEIFNPEYMFFDPTTSLVYRKEQFTLGDDLPCQLIVRDRRYSKSDLESLCRECGIEPIWTRHVRRSHWHEDLPAHDSKAKELLMLGFKK